MKTVKTYIIENGHCDLPTDAKVLTANFADEMKVELWALVDPTCKLESRTFILVRAGEEIEHDSLAYITTLRGMRPWLVYHLFEVMK